MPEAIISAESTEAPTVRSGRFTDGEIRPLPQNEFYQSPFDGRWVDLDEEEVFRLIDMQRQSGTRCGKTKPKTCYTRSVHTKET